MKELSIDIKFGVDGVLRRVENIDGYFEKIKVYYLYHFGFIV